MVFTSNPAPLYPAVGWVGNLLPLSFLFAFNLCVLPRPPPVVRIVYARKQSLVDSPRKVSCLAAGVGSLRNR